MIVKNEEEVLARCLSGTKDIFDEIIIVDTGSADHTREIAERFADTVAEFCWRDDFSAARNYSFSLAHTDYIMWMDADDVIAPEDRAALIRLKSELDGETDIYMLPYRAAPDEDGISPLVYYRERIIRRKSGLSWTGAVHETIPLAGKIAYRDAAVTHKKPPERSTAFRNLFLYAKQFAHGTMPDERKKFYFARELKDNGLYDTAASVYEAFLCGDGWTENKICACRDLADCYKRLHKRQKRLSALFRSFEYAPPRAEICCDIGECCFEEGDLNGAVFWYKLALNEKPDARSGAFVMPDYSGFIPCLWLCVCFDRLGKRDKAEYYNEQAGKIRPHDKSYLYNKHYFENLKTKVKDDE